MNTIKRRVARLEADRGAVRTLHVWQPDSLSADAAAAWLADLRTRERLASGDMVNVYRWTRPGEVAPEVVH